MLRLPARTWTRLAATTLLASALSLTTLAGCAGGDGTAGPEGEPSANEPGAEPSDNGPDGEPDVGTGCTYPENDGSYAVGSVFPNLSFPGAINGDGSTTDFTFEKFHCDAEYERYTSLMILLTAEWCSACPQYVEMVRQLHPELDAAGVKIVSYVAEDRSGGLETNEAAHAYTSNYVADMDWLRVGSDPAGDIRDQAGRLWTATPNVFFIRKSDMVFATSQEDTQYILPLVRIANTIDQDWTDPNNPPFVSTCTDETEEDSEPNDTPDQAASLEVAVPVDGGICASEPDFFRVTEEGEWQLDLLFSHESGDLDIYVANEDGSIMTEADGRTPIGSESVTDNESFTYQGPALIRVHGYQGASAPYTLLLTTEQPNDNGPE